MSLTSYRAAPPRVNWCAGVKGRAVGLLHPASIMAFEAGFEGKQDPKRERGAREKRRGKRVES